MSQDLSLYLLEADLPTPRQWAKAIREQGFKFKLDTDFDIRDSAGFIPCGDEAGFELLSDAMTQEEHDELCFAEPPMDWCVTLCAQGNEDFYIALAALASLASIAGGRIIDMQSGEIFDAGMALVRAREHFEGPIAALDPATAAAVKMLLERVDHTEDGTGQISAEVMLCLERSTLPAEPWMWTSVIHDCGFKFSLYPDPHLPDWVRGVFPMAAYVGRLSCGIDMGFEFVGRPLDAAAIQTLKPHFPQADWAIRLRAAGEVNYCAAYASLSSLAMLTGGAIWNHLSQLVGPKVALAQSKALLARLEPRKGQPDHVTAARTSILAPVMKRHGFRKRGKNTYYRIRGRVGHFVQFFADRWDSRNFWVEYRAELLAPSVHSLGATLLERLARTPAHNGQEWPGETKARAEKSIASIATAIEAHVVPFFDRCSSASGYADEVRRIDGVDPVCPYKRFALGFGRLAAGDAEAALAYLALSREGFHERAQEFDASGTDARWPHERRDAVDSLIHAIAEGRHAALVDAWYREALAAEKLRDD